MVNSRTEATLDVVGLEKALAKMENFLLEFRASRASPVVIFPTFDGSEALAWLARANQYFLINKTPLDRRVDVAINAISGPAMPWLKLLLMRCSSLSWDKFTQELLRRFGDAPIAAVHVAKNQAKVPSTSNDNTTAMVPSLPTMTAPLPSSSLPTSTKQENTLHASPPNSAKQNSADLHAAAKSAVVSSSFPLAAMASTNPLDELSFAALPPAPPPPPLPQPHLQDVLLRVVPPSVVEPTSLLHSRPPPQPQPQFATTPKLLSAPMLLPLPQQKLFPAQSSPDVPHPKLQKLFLPLPRSYPLSSSQQPRPTAFRLLLQLGEYWIPDLCCLPKFSLIALLGFQRFCTLSRVHKLEFEPPPNLSCKQIHPDINTKVDNSTPFPLVVHQPIHISILVHLPSTNPLKPAVVPFGATYSSCGCCIAGHTHVSVSSCLWVHFLIQLCTSCPEA